MSTLEEICSGLLVEPLPVNRGRDPAAPHAPTRTPNLTAAEERVRCSTREGVNNVCVVYGTGLSEVQNQGDERGVELNTDCRLASYGQDYDLFKI